MKKTFLGMIIFFILTVVSFAITFGLQSSTSYKTYAIALFMAVISLFFSLILSIVSLIKDKNYHRNTTIFILVCSGLGVIFALVVLGVIFFYL